MKKVYKLQNLDCAVCAAKMEKAVGKLDGVQNASVNFLAQRMTVEAEGDPDALLELIRQAIRRVESDCKVIG